MKLEIETVIDGSEVDFIGWGMTPEGNAALKIVQGSRRVLLEVTPEEAEAIGKYGVHAALTLMAMRAGPPPAAGLVTTDGRPIIVGRG